MNASFRGSGRERDDCSCGVVWGVVASSGEEHALANANDEASTANEAALSRLDIRAILPS